MDPRYPLALALAVLVVTSGSFAVGVGGTGRPAPVPYDDTVTMGLTQVATVSARSQGYEVPHAEVFYAQYRYVVGYDGITTLVDELHREGHERQFGVPLTVYVTDFAGSDVHLTDEGYLVVPDRPGAETGWVPAEEAFFVVGSDARTSAGPALVPFSDRAAAAAFADAHGGTIESWAAVRKMAFGTGAATRASMRRAVRERHAWADRQVTDARRLLDRPVSVVVGEDAPTLSAAVARAPPNTTVRVPAGSYDANVTVSKPLTVRGAGTATRLHGDGQGSVVRVRAERVAVADLAIDGVGNGTSVTRAPVNQSAWDYRVKLAYAYGDAGVEFDHANGSYVRDVQIDTPANGLLFRWSDRAVVENLTVDGSETWSAGFMGVMDLASRLVVQNSTVVGGRDGVYTHRGDGIVVRSNTFRSLRFGVHEMYTSDALVANNTVRDATIGAVVMTRPSGNALVGNDVRNSDYGVEVSGTASYVAENVLVDDGYGMTVASRQSLYERNLLAHDRVGARAGTILPTNRVVANDFVANGRPATAQLGPLRVWTDRGRGNYWAGAPGRDRNGDGTLDRAYHPTDAVDRRVPDVVGARTLAYSPAVAARRALQGAVPGLRTTGVVDTEPLARPARPTVVARIENETGARRRQGADET
ncbi:MAG: NosD domain-containing protein [Haloarculaceae archaeon]